ncbi:MAG: DNA translocase FtsK [Chloroflexota bacterium]
MASRKEVRKKGDSKLLDGKPPRRGFSRALFSLPPLLVLIFIAVIFALVIIQGDALSFWILSAVSITWGVFGWGLALAIFAAGVLIGIPKRNGPMVFIRRWYRWLGFLTLVGASWGILGLAGWGGSIGLAIGGCQDTFGLIRIMGLIIAGAVLMAPGTTLSAIRSFILLVRQTGLRTRIILLASCVVAVFAGLLFWILPSMLPWETDITPRIWEIFGWGLPLIVVTIVLAAVIMFRRELSGLLHRWKLRNWNVWVGGLVLMFAVWGLLAIFALGGIIGDGIIGYPSPVATGLFRILGLVLLGVILLIPRLIFRAICAPVKWLRNVLRRKRVSPPSPGSGKGLLSGAQKAAAPSGTGGQKKIVPVTAESVSSPGKDEVVSSQEAVPAIRPTRTQQELKQVAQDVWGKYGETSESIFSEGWRLPPIALLDELPEIDLTEGDNKSRARLIEEAIASYGVEAKVVQINAGPTVTQFGVEPGWVRKVREIKEKDRDGNTRIRTEEVSRTRVKVERITSLANDLALALAAPSIRIEAPVPGKSVVGIEVPNTVSGVVSLRSVIESGNFQKMKGRSKLALALGKGAGGEGVAGDLVKMPHLLIAGATGSGKTVCLNAIICCLLSHATPYDVRFIMIDPKRVELTPFNGIPHMATPVVVDTEKALGTLRWLSQEMDNRYKIMAKTGVRNIESYNKSRTGSEKMPYLVLVIDELADLMMTGFEEVEHILCRLAQLARAIGIHLVVATQRPSVDVITGLIKANFPTRISFAVTSQVDSRTIIDMVGAEKLLGRGDMLYLPTDAAKPKRLQGCFVSDAETERLVYFWGSQKDAETVSLNVENIKKPVITGATTGLPDDPLVENARQLAEEHGNISASYLQRQLHIGYNRAARLMEMLTEENKEAEDDGETGKT